MNWREHPKFLFVKDQIEKYISSGEKLGRVYLQDLNDINENREKIRRCPLGVVAFNHGFLIANGTAEAYEELENRFDLTRDFGFDAITQDETLWENLVRAARAIIAQDDRKRNK